MKHNVLLPKLLVACPWGPVASPRTLSGVPYYFTPYLNDHFETVVADVENSPLLPTSFNLLLRRISKRLLPKLRRSKDIIFPGASRHTAKAFSNWLVAQIERHRPDAVMTFGYSPLVYHKLKIPAFMYVDHAFQYKAMSHIFDWIKAEQVTSSELADIVKCDSAGLANCQAAFTTSPKIAEGIKQYYPQFSAKLKPVGIGANFTEVTERPLKRQGHNLNLIFLSTHFERKGGFFAIELFKELKKSHAKLALHVVGDHSQIRPTEGIVIHGWLDKSQPAGLAKYQELLSQMHLHILPTRGDLTPHAICEMNAYGVPTISRDIGGIADLIENGASGELVSGDDMADWINGVEKILTNLEPYSASAFNKYRNEQTWRQVANKVAPIIQCSI